MDDYHVRLKFCLCVDVHCSCISVQIIFDLVWLFLDILFVYEESESWLYVNMMYKHVLYKCMSICFALTWMFDDARLLRIWDTLLVTSSINICIDAHSLNVRVYMKLWPWPVLTFLVNAQLDVYRKRTLVIGLYLTIYEHMFCYVQSYMPYLNNNKYISKNTVVLDLKYCIFQLLSNSIMN